MPDPNDPAAEELRRQLFHLQALHDIGREIAPLQDVRAILRVAALSVVGTLGTSAVVVLLDEGPAFGSGAETVFSMGLGVDDQTALRAAWQDRADQAGQQSLVRTLSGSGDDSWDAALWRADLQVWMPIEIEAGTAGGIGLGRRLSGAPYAEDDLNLLETIQMSVQQAVHNAYLYTSQRAANAALEELNRELENRVGERTRDLETVNRELAGKNAALAQKNQELEESIDQRRVLQGQLSQLSEREAQRWGLEDFVDQSPTMQRIFAQIRTLQTQAGTRVLIAGERGTGKELVARAIHFDDSREEGAFVGVACPTFPREVASSLEQRTQALSRLLGHARGAFAGADADQDGYVQQAHRGTLFLDEIGAIPLPLQSHLLRLLTQGEVRRLGSATSQQVDVRVLAATSMDLPAQVKTGAFHQGFYDFLTQMTVEVPPLRQRPEDIPLLAQHFVRFFMQEMGRQAPALHPEALEQLQAYSFPGNVRELKNIVERALIESDGAEVQPQHLHL